MAFGQPREIFRFLVTSCGFQILAVDVELCVGLNDQARLFANPIHKLVAKFQVCFKVLVTTMVH